MRTRLAGTVPARSTESELCRRVPPRYWHSWYVQLALKPMYQLFAPARARRRRSGPLRASSSSPSRGRGRPARPDRESVLPFLPRGRLAGTGKHGNTPGKAHRPCRRDRSRRTRSAHPARHAWLPVRAEVRVPASSLSWLMLRASDCLRLPVRHRCAQERGRLALWNWRPWRMRRLMSARRPASSAYRERSTRASRRRTDLRHAPWILYRSDAGAGWVSSTTGVIGVPRLLSKPAGERRHRLFDLLAW